MSASKTITDEKTDQKDSPSPKSGSQRGIPTMFFFIVAQHDLEVIP